MYFFLVFRILEIHPHLPQGCTKQAAITDEAKIVGKK
jgi:hypothetical protein